jgi:hypothetical protein
MAWPSKKVFGTDIAAGGGGATLVTQNPSPAPVSAPIQVWNHARNGKPPTTPLINQLNEAGNQAILYRSKEVFSASGYVGVLGGEIPSSAGAGDRLRWRWAFHTGPYSRGLLVKMIMHPQDSGLGDNSYARIDIKDGPTLAASTVGTVTFNHGANPTGSNTGASGLAYLKASQQYIEGLDPDTDYYGYAYDVDNGRMIAICVADIPSMTENYDGYLATNITAESSILSTYRENLATISNALWKRGGAQVFNFSIEEPGAIRTVSAATPNNIIDQGVAAYSASEPGYQIDMTGKARLSQVTSGVPIKFAAFVDVPAANTGVVSLRDDAGTAIINITQAGAYTGWIVNTGVLPASDEKYYITHHRSAGAGDITTYAVSCWEYET